MSSSQKDVACKIRFSLLSQVTMWFVYVTLIILFALKYRISATVVLICFMVIMKLLKTLCSRPYIDTKHDAVVSALQLIYYQLMYFGMFVVSWLPIDSLFLRVITNALVPIILAVLCALIPSLMISMVPITTLLG